MDSITPEALEAAGFESFHDGTWGLMVGRHLMLCVNTSGSVELSKVTRADSQTIVLPRAFSLSEILELIRVLKGAKA